MGLSAFPPSRHASTNDTPVLTRNSSPPRPLVLWPVDGQPLSAQRRPYRACLDQFLPEARAIPASEVTAVCGDARLVLANVRFGLDTACARPAEVERHLPLLDFGAVIGIADLARALVYATMRVVKSPSDGEMRRRIAAVKASRGAMASMAVTLASKGIVSAREVPRARARGGVPEMAAHAVALGQFYATHAESIRGCHPFTDEEITALGENGEWLLENLKPARARRRAKPHANTPQDDRDRLWTLLSRRHLELRKVASYFHPEDPDAFAPPLLSAKRAVAYADEDAGTDEDAGEGDDTPEEPT